MAQIRWLSELALFDFDIKYRTGKSNQAVDALGHCPTSSEDSSRDVESKEYKALSYEIVNDNLTSNVNGVELPTDINEIQRSIHD